MANAHALALLRQAVEVYRSGDISQAEQLCRRALAGDESAADAWYLLAIALADQSRLDEAAQAIERATALRRGVSEYWLTRGSIEEARGNASAAQAAFRRVISLSPRTAVAHYGLARILHREGKFKDAIAAYRAALRDGAAPADFHYNFARALAADNRLQEALPAYQEAFAHDPQGALDRRECIDRIGRTGLAALPEFWHGELIRFFARTDVDKSHYAAAGLRVLMLRADFDAVQSAAEGPPSGRFEPPQAELDRVMADELLGILLRDTVLANPGVELLLTRLRETLLLQQRMRARAPLAFLCDLALQCVNNEFVYAEGSEETRALGELAREIEARLRAPDGLDEPFTRSLAVFAAYRPLHALSASGSLPARAAQQPALERLLRRTVTDRIEEQRLRGEIAASSDITDPVSLCVRAQYEENSYPRWLSIDRAQPISAADWICANVPGLAGTDHPAQDLRILVAGCGTGSGAISLACEIEGVRVTALDLSLSSLAYARRIAAQMGVAGVDFVHGDILELERSAERFDLIHCVGVLHHLRDPRQGLRALVGRLRPGGLLHVGLYSARARSAVNAARALIAERQLPPTAEAIRSVRRLVLEAEPGSPLHGLMRVRDFFTMSECRDLMFHVQEHQFRLPEAVDMLRSEGLEVLGVAPQTLAHALPHYRSLFPDDERLTDPQRWDAVEAQHPAAFESMYRIWCRSGAA